MNRLTWGVGGTQYAIYESDVKKVRINAS